jgi:hypothetical protein
MDMARFILVGGFYEPGRSQESWIQRKHAE